MNLVVGKTIALLGVAMVVAILARRLRLPYTVGLVLSGLALALAHVDAGVTLTHDVIFDVILPPLLFEAAISIRWSELRRDLPFVLALSTLGVALCALVVAAGLTALLSGPAGRRSPSALSSPPPIPSRSSRCCARPGSRAACGSSSRARA